MKNRRPVLVVISILFVILPLMRFLSSPTYEVGRAVDMVLLFAAGMSAGVVLRSVLQRSAATRA